MIAALILFAVELITRATQPYVNPMGVFSTAPVLLQSISDQHNRVVFEYDPERTWRLRPNLRNKPGVGTMIVATNAQFMRMDHDIAPKKPGQLRVICMGDSVSFGCCVPFYWEGKWNAEERFYAEILQRTLSEKLPERQPEVILLACPGYSSTQGRLWLEQVIDEYQPDIITACYGWNDIYEAGLTDRQTMPQTGTERFARHLADKSQVFTKLVHWRNQRVAAKEPISFGLPRTNIEDYLRNFLLMNETARAAGAKFAIIGPVYRDSKVEPQESERITFYRKKLGHLADAMKVPFLLIPELTEEHHPANNNLFADPSHPGARGHAIMGERISGLVLDMVSKMP